MMVSTRRIATVLVQSSRATFQTASHAGNLSARLDFLQKCAEVAEYQDCRTLVLPAGFFFVPPLQRPDLENQILKVLEPFKLITAFGIDEGEKITGDKSDKSGGQSNNLPNFGYVHEGGRFLVEHVRQLGNRVEHVSRDQVRREIARRLGRSTVLEGRKVALILCGELLSSAWRDELVLQKPDFIFHPAHAEVRLGSRIREAFACRLDELLDELPDAVWAFADHVMALEHLADGRLVHLVRHRGGRDALLVETFQIVVKGIVGKLCLYQV
jgi:hypothetical protein